MTYPWIYEFYTPEGKGIIAELDQHGICTFAIEAGKGSSVRGTDMFDRMVDHFGGALLGIHGVWLKGLQGRPSSNIDKVNELTGFGMAIEEAILNAWTATRAARRGLRKVQLLGVPTGQVGRYTRIDVLIER